MKQVQRDVARFSKEAGLFVQDEGPRWPEGTEAARADIGGAIRQIREEFKELILAASNRDMIEIADAAADLVWVVLQLCVRLGIYLPPIWDEVTKTNMAKLNGANTLFIDGKIQKPPNWTPPDIKRILRKQVEIGNWLRKAKTGREPGKPQEKKPKAPDRIEDADSMG